MFPFLKNAREWYHNRNGSSRKLRRTRLFLEALEDRTVPTVVFNSAFGGETVTTTSQHQALNDPTVYLIFWGKSWTQSNASGLANDAQAIMQSSYLSGLTQYGSDGKAVYGGYYIDNSSASTSSGANATKEINNVLPNQSSWLKPQDAASKAGSTYWPGVADSPIYVVVFDTSGATGNGSDAYKPSADANPLAMAHIWISDQGANQDNFTDLFSHELVECMSSGIGGLSMNAPVNISGEYQNAQIADNEPDGGRYTYRLDGYLKVQAYWSNTNQAFIVPDGTHQTVYLTPAWSNTKFLNNFSLSNSGQGSNQNVTLDTTNDQGMYITLNGEHYQFDPGQITTATLRTGGGNNTVNLNSLPSGVEAELISGGSLTINYDTSSAVQGSVVLVTTSAPTIAYTALTFFPTTITITPTTATVDQNAPLTYSAFGGQSLNVVGFSNVVLDDTADGDGQQFNVNSNGVGFGAAAVGYRQVGSLTIEGGGGGNTFTVQGTSVPLTLDTGDGNSNTVDLLADSAAVNIVGQAAQTDNVTIGSATGSNGTLSAITGPVNLNQGTINLVLDDEADPNSHNVDVSSSGVTFYNASISFTPLHFFSLNLGVPVWVEQPMATINFAVSSTIARLQINSPKVGGSNYYASGFLFWPGNFSDVYVESTQSPFVLARDSASGPNAPQIIFQAYPFQLPSPIGHLSVNPGAISFSQTLSIEEFELTLYTVLDRLLGAMSQPHTELDAALAKLQAATAGNPSMSTLHGRLAVLEGESAALNALSGS